MCGFVGQLALGTPHQAIDAAVIDRMRDAVAHRGPDGARSWIDPRKHVALGFRRLAIIDLSEAAMQPMSSADGRIRLVFNGEIYNHTELRSELERDGGHRFVTDHSDTEVLVHAFEQWGIDCLSRLDGMFAIAIWDERNGALWLVRDRIGIKPLYYSISPGRVRFASEIKALLEDPEQPRILDEESFFHYLSFRATPSPQTLFQGIEKLPAGHWLRIDRAGRTQQTRYWDVWDHVTPLHDASEARLTEAILGELEAAVERRKIGDVPVGVFLSGGVDSSTNAALFARGEDQPIRTYSIGYDRDYSSYRNELAHARRMADVIGSLHRERVLTQEDLIEFLPRMAWLQDEPVADPVCFPVHAVSALARQDGTIVCQVGEGADELYFGYPHWAEVLRRQQRLDRLLPDGAGALAASALGWAGARFGSLAESFQRASRGIPQYWSGAEVFLDGQKRPLLSHRLRKRFAGLSSWEILRPIHDRFLDRAWDPNPLHWMTYCDLQFRLPELLLMRVDKMSMGVGLECRVPFLDHHFVELALSIPAERKIAGGKLKYLLKQAVRGVIPDDLIDRPKQGFGVPVHEWTLEHLGGLMATELEYFCDETDLLDRQMVRELLYRRHGRELYVLLNFVLWWRKYLA